MVAEPAVCRFFSFWIELVCLHHRGDNSPVRVDEFFEIEKSPRDVVDVLPVSVTPWCRYAAHSAILLVSAVRG